MNLLLISTFLFSLLFQTNAIYLNQSNNKLQKQLPTSIKYQQKLGTCFGSSSYSSLLNFINKASIYYRDDHQQNIKYIKQNMDDRFSNGSSSYIVVILVNQTKSEGYYQYFYNIQACNYAILPKGVNKINTKWSYLVYKIEYSASLNWNYVHDIAKGQAISSDIQNSIKMTIINSEGKESKCSCPSLNISIMLQKTLGKSWSTICLPTFDIYGYIPTKTNQWIIIHPKLCYYLIYTNQE